MAEKPKKLNRFESGSVELGVMSEEATSFVYYGNMPTECIQFLHNELPVFHKSTAQQINEEAAASLRGVEEETDLESSEDEYNNIYSKDGWLPVSFIRLATTFSWHGHLSLEYCAGAFSECHYKYAKYPR